MEEGVEVEVEEDVDVEATVDEPALSVFSTHSLCPCPCGTQHCQWGWCSFFFPCPTPLWCETPTLFQGGPPAPLQSGAPLLSGPPAPLWGGPPAALRWGSPAAKFCSFVLLFSTLSLLSVFRPIPSYNSFTFRLH